MINLPPVNEQVIAIFPFTKLMVNMSALCLFFSKFIVKSRKKAPSQGN